MDPATLAGPIADVAAGTFACANVIGAIIPIIEAKGICLTGRLMP